jgi:hypothetical protein
MHVLKQMGGSVHVHNTFLYFYFRG